jgi:hypothetical protein
MNLLCKPEFYQKFIDKLYFLKEKYCYYLQQKNELGRLQIQESKFHPQIIKLPIVVLARLNFKFERLFLTKRANKNAS